MAVKNRACCCSWSFKTGTIIIGNLCLISNLVAIGLLADSLLYHKYSDGVTRITYVTKAHLIAGFVSYTIKIVCNILLLLGAKEEKALLLLPWVVVQTVTILIQTMIGIDYIMKTANFTAVIIFVIVMGINLYLLLVVYSYYRILKEKQETARGQREDKNVQVGQT